MKFRNIADNTYVDLPPGVSVSTRVSCNVLVKRNGLFLMVKTGIAGLWEFPGGAVDMEETSLLDAARREVKDESGYEVRMNNSNPFFSSIDFVYHPREDVYHKVFAFYFRGELVSENKFEQVLDEPDEIVDVSWKNIKQMKDEEFSFYLRKNLDKLRY